MTACSVLPRAESPSLSLDSEHVEVIHARGFAPLHFDTFDFCVCGAAFDPMQQVLEFFACAFGDDFDISSIQVFGTACQAEIGSATLHEAAVANTLHGSSHEGGHAARLLAGFGAAQVHALFDHAANDRVS
jgi:hypothetical protein